MTLLEALATRERYPRRRETGARRCEDVVRVKSLDALRADVDEDASFWVDGSSKDFKGLSADERALLNAGRLVRVSTRTSTDVHGAVVDGMER